MIAHHLCYPASAWLKDPDGGAWQANGKRGMPRNCTSYIAIRTYCQWVMMPTLSWHHKQKQQAVLQSRHLEVSTAEALEEALERDASSEEGYIFWPTT